MIRRLFLLAVVAGIAYVGVQVWPDVQRYLQDASDVNPCASGSPARSWRCSTTHEHLARVEVSGVGRVINIGLLEDEQIVAR